MRRLVNALLATLIIGVVAIVLALVWKIKQTPLIGVSGRADTETVVAATADDARILLTLRDRETGAERVVVIDAETLRPVGEIRDGAAGPR